MIAKIIAVARTRNEAIDTMHRALSEYIIEGVKTTIPFHLQLMKDERFRAGDFNTKFSGIIQIALTVPVSRHRARLRMPGFVVLIEN
jgi:biotin carboxylase